MKRSLSIAVVAAVAVGSVGSYVAHANPDLNVRAPRALALNITVEQRIHRSECAAVTRQTIKDVRSHGVAYARNQANYFAVLQNTSFNVSDYVCDTAQITFDTQERMANALLDEMDALIASNQTIQGANVNSAGGILWKPWTRLHSTNGRNDRKINRVVLSNVKRVNRGDNIEAAWNWNGTGTSPIPVPGIGGGTYRHFSNDPGFVFVMTIPSSPGFSQIYACGYAPVGNSASVDMFGENASGFISSTFPDSDTGCFFGSGSVSGSGNVMCELVSNSVTCGRMGATVGCAPPFSESIQLDR